MNELKEIDITKIIEIPSDVEIPVYDNIQQTRRALCASYPENRELIDKLEAVLVDNSPTECTSDLFEYGDYTVIDNIEDLKKFLSEVLIRFDTSPKYYTKADYQHLLVLLYRSLLYLYREDQGIEIGPNLSEIFDLTDKVLELQEPVAQAGDVIDESKKRKTIPSVSYVDSHTIKWKKMKDVI